MHRPFLATPCPAGLRDRECPSAEPTASDGVDFLPGKALAQLKRSVRCGESDHVGSDTPTSSANIPRSRPASS